MRQTGRARPRSYSLMVFYRCTYITCFGWHLHLAEYYSGIYFDGFLARITFFVVAILPFCHFLHIALRSHVLHSSTVTINVSTISVVGRTKWWGILLHVFRVRPHSIHRSDVSCISFFILNGKITLVTEFDECNTMVLYHDYDTHTHRTCSMFIVFVAQKHEPSQCERMQHDRDCRILFSGTEKPTPTGQQKNGSHFFIIKYFCCRHAEGSQEHLFAVWRYFYFGKTCEPKCHAAMLVSGQKCPSTQTESY